MKILTAIEAAQLVAKTLKKPVIFLSSYVGNGVKLEEIFQAAPYLTVKDHFQIALDGHGIIVCNSIKE